MYIYIYIYIFICRGKPQGLSREMLFILLHHWTATPLWPGIIFMLAVTRSFCVTHSPLPAHDSAKSKYIRDDIETMRHEMRRGSQNTTRYTRMKRQATVAKRLSLLWAPLAKAKVLAGLRVSSADSASSCVIRGAEAMAESLATSWAPTFAH